MIEQHGEEPEFHLQKKYEENYTQLQEILGALKELGLTPFNLSAEDIQDQWDMSNTFPIANEGAQGIRITRSRDGGLTVSFTNGFEDSKNQKRIEVTTKLREMGFDVV